MSGQDSITIDDVRYIRADSLPSQMADSVDGMPYVVVRTYSDGVHVGYLASSQHHPGGFDVELRQARRCNRFFVRGGFGGCSELADRGPEKKESRITKPIATHRCVAIGITPVTTEAKARIDSCHE